MPSSSLTMFTGRPRTLAISSRNRVLIGQEPFASSASRDAATVVRRLQKTMEPVSVPGLAELPHCPRPSACASRSLRALMSEIQEAVPVQQRSTVSKRLHRPPYSRGEDLPRNVRVVGRIVAGSAIQVVDAVRAAPGQAGRAAPVYPVCPARELLAGRYARCGTQTPR
jgi:hypothetical protein